MIYKKAECEVFIEQNRLLMDGWFTRVLDNKN